MKFRVLILVLLLTNHAFPQEGYKEPLFLSISCGFAAQTDQEIVNFRHHASLKDSVIIKKYLHDGSDLEQVLSAILLRYYYSKGQLQLSTYELRIISAISKSKRKYELCYTCTFQEKGTIKDLFKKKNETASYSIIEGYLLKSF
jgi:hypothetical protein